MSDVRIIAVTAWPAAGKSVATREIIEGLKGHGKEVALLTDKFALLAQVEHEIEQAGKSLKTREPIEVDNFTLLNPWERRVSWGIKFKNAFTLNEAHRRMLDSIAYYARDLNAGTTLVAELAYGENAQYPDGNLRQNAKDYLDQFEHLGLLPYTAFVDIFARLKVRDPRNEGRRNEVGYIPREEFIKYFKDLGGWSKKDRSRLNGRFVRINNEVISREEYQRQVSETTQRFLMPLVNGEGALMRGKERR